jgi:hypothetical protein
MEPPLSLNNTHNVCEIFNKGHMCNNLAASPCICIRKSASMSSVLWMQPLPSLFIASLRYTKQCKSDSGATAAFSHDFLQTFLRSYLEALSTRAQHNAMCVPCFRSDTDWTVQWRHELLSHHSPRRNHLVYVISPFRIYRTSVTPTVYVRIIVARCHFYTIFVIKLPSQILVLFDISCYLHQHKHCDVTRDVFIFHAALQVTSGRLEFTWHLNFSWLTPINFMAVREDPQVLYSTTCS